MKQEWTEEYIAGLNLLSCYDFIEQSCEFILKQLRVVQKQRECPEECRESVGSLMFAAARFSDMPELRELRDTFQERYGSSLEHFVNHEFVEKMALKPPTMEKKLQLLQDIALEFSLNWDSKGFEQRMDNPPAFALDQPKKYMSVHGNDEKFKLPISMETATKTDKRNELSKGRTEPTKDMRNCKEDSFLKRDELDRQFLRREELTGDRDKPLTPKRDNNGIPYQGRRELVAEKHDSLNGKEDNALRIVRPGHSPRGKRTEFVECGYEVQNGMMNIVSKRDGQAPVTDRKPEVTARVTTVPSAGNSHYGRPEMANPRSSIQEEETERLKSYPSNALPPPYLKSKDKFVPPPYIKSKDGNCGASTEAKHASFEFDGTAVNPSMRNRDGVVLRSEKAHRESDHSSLEDQVVGSTERVLPYRNDIPLPRPRSIRRKPSKLSSNRDDLGNSEDAAGKGSSSSRRRDDPRRGSPILFEEDQYWKDEEERKIDKLLLHYSTKPSTFDPDKLRRKSRPHASDQIPAAVGETSHYRIAGRNTVEAMVPLPSRSVSLPREPTAMPEVVKNYTRANSFQPEKHVHPKLPDYDDLAARFAAMRGR
ncbi:uncharacterized protein LOC131302125 isoform X2 [Rhododendron vialii]|uniref:uncharacterized protein LOC131302125 isoform X2 n=1 Tax=Rhododendron vialii TaxID=182163 RepID=UPI00265DB3EE|nr:uncharacterized protein LOC131302125 isoform X2 [Rhododendron vialii]